MRCAYRATLEQSKGSFYIGIRLVRNAVSGTGSVSGTDLQNTNSNSGGKILIAYFSWGGNTKGVAEEIQRQTGADLFEIKPKTPYTRADLDWTDKKSRSSIETYNPDCRPEIADTLANMGDYSTVILGFPIWWYVAPKIINTFVESYDFLGKTVIPFATSGGSGMEKTTEVLKNLCPDANWVNGKVVNGMSENALADWADTF